MSHHRIHSLSALDEQKVCEYAKSVGAVFTSSGGYRGFFMTIESDKPLDLKSLDLSCRATIDAKEPVFAKR